MSKSTLKRAGGGKLPPHPDDARRSSSGNVSLNTSIRSSLSLGSSRLGSTEVGDAKARCQVSLHSFCKGITR